MGAFRRILSFVVFFFCFFFFFVFFRPLAILAWPRADPTRRTHLQTEHPVLTLGLLVLLAFCFRSDSGLCPGVELGCTIMVDMVLAQSFTRNRHADFQRQGLMVVAGWARLECGRVREWVGGWSLAVAGGRGGGGSLVMEDSWVS